MKLSKISLALVAAAGLLSLASSVRAQDPAPATPTQPPANRRGGGGGAFLNPTNQLVALEKALGETNKLSDAQKPKIMAALEDQSKKMQELRGSGAAQEEIRTKRTAITDDTAKKMKEVLNAEQFKQYEAFQTQQRGRGRRNGAGGGAAGGAAPGGAGQ